LKKKATRHDATKFYIRARAQTSEDTQPPPLPSPDPPAQHVFLIVLETPVKAPVTLGPGLEGTSRRVAAPHHTHIPRHPRAQREGGFTLRGSFMLRVLGGTGSPNFTTNQISIIKARPGHSHLPRVWAHPLSEKKGTQVTGQTGSGPGEIASVPATGEIINGPREGKRIPGNRTYAGGATAEA